MRLPCWVVGHEWRPRTSARSHTGTVKNIPASLRNASLPTGRERGVVFGQPRWQQVLLQMRRWLPLATFIVGTTVGLSISAELHSWWR